MPVRRIPPSHRAITGRLAALKAIGPAHYESALERDYLITLEADPTVLAYEIQPIRLDYRDSLGQARRYTPDVLVFRQGDVIELVEVKYVADIQELRVKHRERWVMASHYAREQGWHFRLITERHARTPRARNWLFLSTFRVMTPPPELLTRMQAVLAASGPLSISAWLSQLEEPDAEVLPFVWHLLCLGKVTVNLNQPLSLAATVSLVPAEVTHA
ncbi:TnsA endonuclease N-terminal domain-containing protein [Deinococcus sp.]|uniref:TnsA endonuclease N-terminal domain-containing protein n=1 Tax=Deinococcus sp. TaxID=47478 RepID=UPI0025DCC6D2|nr:TnsA endonuclease N-terminal domain-containing protein [Deinococcus sp.]